ncbi:hypothetical protein CNMCM5793_006796 [Aspergillus hiratsukae]|uniref:Uncharacterized protein n=1 Tax=Aspergillus hiratsukae TaxID=1194566 RepID=A0A8H6UBL9_9EURO|nr:hypothetical protein CNMCM5793_006796 [Aspergillus hiratsukae]
MVQVKVATALQENYTRDQPFQIINPTPTTSSGKCNAPIFTTVTDSRGNLNLFYVFESDRPEECTLYNVYLDDSSNTWKEEDTGWQCPPGLAPYPGIIKAARQPDTGQLHVAIAHTVTTASGGLDLTVHYLDLGTRFPKWQSVNVSGQDTDESPQYFSGLDLSFKDGSIPLLTIQLKHALYNPLGFYLYPTWMWIPSQGSPFTGTNAMPDVGTVWDLCFGRFPDWTRDPGGHTSSWGWYAINNLDAWHPGTVGYVIRLHFQLNEDVATIAAGNDSMRYTRVDCMKILFFENTGYSPLLLILRTSPGSRNSPRFVTNNNYSQGTDPLNNETPLFSDVDGSCIWIDAAVKTRSDSEMSGTDLTLDVFGLFEIYNGPNLVGVEVWHTQTMGGSLVAGGDGIFSVQSSGWSASSKLTDDVFSTLQCPFLRAASFDLRNRSPNSYSMSVTTVDNETVCTVLGQDRTFNIWKQNSSDGVWRKDKVESAQTNAASTVTKTDCYYVDVTAVDDDGIPQANLVGKFGTTIATLIELNGTAVGLQPDQEVDVQFNSGGRLGVTLHTFGSLIPDTFWLWVDGMDQDTRIDIQPAAENLHNNLQTCTKDDMAKIAGPNVDVNDLIGAASALNQVSTLITGSSNEPIKDSQGLKYVHPRTSLHVARARKGPRSSTDLGHLPVGHDFGFHISFEGGIRCRKMGSAEASKVMETRKSQYPHGFLGIDWGDLWDNVESAVYTVADVICTVVADAVQVIVEITVKGVKWLWNGIIDLATQAADIAGAVFASIEATWEKIKDWLGFLFDWDDINRSAQHFKDAVHTCDADILNFVNNTLAGLNAAFFDNVRANMNNWFTKSETYFGGETIGHYDQKSAMALPAGVDITSIDLPSPASWILNKLLGLFGSNDGAGILGEDARGIDDFTNTLTNLLDVLISQQTKTDFDKAIAALQTLLLNITNRGVFDGVTFASLLNLVQALAVIGVDIVQNIVTLVIHLIQFLASRLVSFLEEPLDIPGISWLYEHITGDKSPSSSSVICFAIAIPFTITYKLVFNRPPFPPSTLKVELSPPEEIAQHSVMGALGIVFGFYNLLDDIGDLMKQETGTKGGFSARLAFINRWLRNANFANPAKGSAESNAVVAGGGSDVHPSTPQNLTLTIDDLAKMFNYAATMSMLIRVGGQQSLMNLSIEAKDATRVLEAFAGGIAGCLGVYYIYSDAPTSNHDVDAVAALLVGSVGNLVGLLKLSTVKDPRVRIAAGAIGFCTTETVAGLHCAIAAGFSPHRSKSRQVDRT